MSRGFVIIAENTDIDYVRLAYGCALAIKATQSYGVSLITTSDVPEDYRWIFDKIIPITNDRNKTALEKKWRRKNDWQAYYLSPYSQTMKIEADVLLLNNIDHWWDLVTRQVNFTGNVYTYRNELIPKDNVCRQIFIENNLVNIYNAIMYFEKSTFADNFFTVAQITFEAWNEIYHQFLTKPTLISADVSYAIACKLFPEIDFINPVFEFVHMKPELQGINTDRWTSELQIMFNNDFELRIENQLQSKPFHYVEKDFIERILLQLHEGAK